MWAAPWRNEHGSARASLSFLVWQLSLGPRHELPALSGVSDFVCSMGAFQSSVYLVFKQGNWKKPPAILCLVTLDPMFCATNPHVRGVLQMNLEYQLKSRAFMSLLVYFP